MSATAIFTMLMLGIAAVIVALFAFVMFWLIAVGIAFLVSAILLVIQSALARIPKWGRA